MEEHYIIKKLRTERLVVIGHRGAAGYEVENTLRSIERAIDIGVDIVEVDVRSTKDGKIILLHDDNFKRLAGLDLKARELSYSEILHKVDLNGEKVPLLDEAIELIDGKVGLFIEIKEPDTTRKVIDIIRERNAEDWVGIVSFFDEALITAKKILPKIPTGLIYFKPPGRIFDAKKIKANIVLPRYNLATEKANSTAHRLKLFVITWTVNDISLAQKLIARGVDGIASDFPDKILSLKSKIF